MSYTQNDEEETRSLQPLSLEPVFSCFVVQPSLTATPPAR